jgi:hypothetical protein
MLSHSSLKVVHAAPSTLASTTNPIMTLKPPTSSSSPPPTSGTLAPVESSIFAESALVDKETGRIFWEGGASSTLSASIQPRLHHLGIIHAKAIFLSTILLVALIGSISTRLRMFVQHSRLYQLQPRPLLVSLILWILQRVVLGTPRFNRAFALTVYALYIWESWTSNTRAYLRNTLWTPEQVEAFLETLRREKPVVTWNVRSFHYETPLWLTPWLWIRQRLFPSSTSSSISADTTSMDTTPSDTTTAAVTPASTRHHIPETAWLKRKVVTHQATGQYRLPSCYDKTTAGIWRRAPITPAPFAKMVISQLLVLAHAEARQDYLQQQSDFVRQQQLRTGGYGDDYAEYSTSLHTHGFRSRMLIIRPHAETGSVRNVWWLRPIWFWTCTLAGLTVPFRLWFSEHCDEIRVTVVKEARTWKSSSNPTSSSSSSSSSSGSSSSSSWWKYPWYATGSLKSGQVEESNLSHHLSEEEEQNYQLVMQQLLLYSTPKSDNTTLATNTSAALTTINTTVRETSNANLHPSLPLVAKEKDKIKQEVKLSKEVVHLDRVDPLQSTDAATEAIDTNVTHNNNKTNISKGSVSRKVENDDTATSKS